MYAYVLVQEALGESAILKFYRHKKEIMQDSIKKIEVLFTL